MLVIERTRLKNRQIMVQASLGQNTHEELIALQTISKNKHQMSLGELRQVCVCMLFNR